MKKKLLYAITCALGILMMCFFVRHIDNVYGSVLFTVGSGLMVFSIIKLSK